MINSVVLVGRITKDLDLKYTSSNIAVVKFVIAVNRKFSTDGEKEADFILCVAWRKQAENMVKFVGKGSLIGIEGHILTGSYDDKDGVRKYTTEVVCDSVQFLESKKQDNGMYPEKDERQKEYERKQSTPTIDVAEDDLPFR